MSSVKMNNEQVMQKEILEQRLKELGWSKYRLAKELSKLRTSEEGELPPASTYQSTVTKALQDPSNIKVSTLEDLIKALGGEIIVRWLKTEEIVTGYDDVKIE